MIAGFLPPPGSDTALALHNPEAQVADPVARFMSGSAVGYMAGKFTDVPAAATGDTLGAGFRALRIMSWAVFVIFAVEDTFYASKVMPVISLKPNGFGS